jgi:hypothetical protein
MASTAFKTAAAAYFAAKAAGASSDQALFVAKTTYEAEKAKT